MIATKNHTWSGKPKNEVLGYTSSSGPYKTIKREIKEVLFYRSQGHENQNRFLRIVRPETPFSELFSEL